MIEALLFALLLAVIGVAVWMIVSGTRRQREAEEDAALAELLRRQASGHGFSEDDMPDEMLEKAERAQRRLREEGR